MVSRKRIDVWSDVVCPWCYIGRERLWQAIREAGLSGKVDVHHQAYQLDPARDRSAPLPQWLERRFGPEWRSMVARVKKVGAELSLEVDFEKAVAANSRLAHRLVKAADASGKGDDVLGRLMEAHFRDGLDIADPAILQRLAVEAGLPSDAVQAVLTSDAFNEEVDGDLSLAARLGIRGVPFFLFDHERAFSGAQPLQTFQEALRATVDADPPG